MNTALYPRPSHVPASNAADIDIYALPGSETDLHAAWKQLQTDQSPEFLWTPHNGGHWIVTLGHHIKQILLDHTRFSNAPLFNPGAKTEHFKLLPLHADQPEHAQYRNAANRAVASKYIAKLRDPAKQIVGEIIDSVQVRGRCEFVSDIASVFPIKLFLAYAGLPATDFERLVHLSAYLSNTDQGLQGDALVTLVDDYLQPIVTQRMHTPGNDPLSRIFQEPVFDKPMTVDIAQAIARDILLAGVDTVSSQIGFIAYHLARSQHHRAILLEKPELVPVAVDDLLRRYNAVALSRTATEDVRFGDITIKKGDALCLPLALYNLDDKLFKDPMNAVFERRDEHIAFGAGIHRCPGVSLARMQMTIFTNAWLERIPEFSIDTSRPIRFTSGVIGSLRELHLTWPIQ
ncbi:MAG: cytochrome P450 [Burkholderiaceae bacterium]|nr:cytochrome P450 [Burkholderiaceae bacterium]